jgi:hypothetical protein
MAGHPLPETVKGQALLTERLPPAVSAPDAASALDAAFPLHARFSPDAELPLDAPLTRDAAIPLNAPLALDAEIPLATKSADSAVTDSSGVRTHRCAAASERATVP